MMGSRIRVLSDETINQIAAGEVIENPASVVKELVENALDALATQVLVAIKGGGLQSILISDDGLGMNRDDAILCFERHATSKIKEAADLLQLGSMGFRGEALATIAAISKITLQTATQDAVGTKVEIEAGRILSVEPCARRRGTTIEVRALFYNVPARKKFQKSAPLCAAEITRILNLISLAHPERKFELKNQEKEVLSFDPIQGASLLDALFQRAESVLGAEFTNGSFPLDIREGEVEVRGLIGAPGQGRPSRASQHVFINQRPVFCPLISFAVRDGYGTRIAEGRHPIFVLHLKLPASLVDVNVHPQKKEVRLREEKYIRDKIQQAVSLSLQGRKEEKESGNFPHFAFTGTPFGESKLPAAPLAMPVFKFQEEKPAPLPVLPWEQEEAIEVIGLFSSYLIVEAESLRRRLKHKEKGESGIFFLDLHAAQLRVAFDSYLQQGEAAFEKQGLLFPESISFSALEAQEIEGSLEEFEKLGFSLRPSGRLSFLVEAIPAFIDVSSLSEALLTFALELKEAKRAGDFIEKRHRYLALAAAKFIKAHKKRFMLQEAQALLEKLLQSSDPLFCPEGNPIMAHISLYETAKFFSSKRQGLLP